MDFLKKKTLQITTLVSTEGLHKPLYFQVYIKTEIQANP